MGTIGGRNVIDELYGWLRKMILPRIKSKTIRYGVEMGRKVSTQYREYFTARLTHQATSRSHGSKSIVARVAD